MNVLTESMVDVPGRARGGAISIGNFDGVHRGHRSLVTHLRKLADEVHGPAVIVTFDPPPAKLLRPEVAPESLTLISRRVELLKGLGIDEVVIIPTSHELLSLEPEQFFMEIIRGQFAAKAVVEGENFRFGRLRRGDVKMLTDLCRQNSIHFSMVTPATSGGEWISSSRIRSLLEAGNVADANQLLLEPYRITGIVVHGAARGRTLGFPTANLEQIPVLCPPLGVYAGRTLAQDRDAGDRVQRLEPLPCAVHIGPNPTFGERAVKVEAHIIGFQGDLYDQTLSIELLEKLRSVKKFDSKDALLEQLALDVNQTRKIAAAYEGSSFN
jgi:riboflavin kinase/FMN adenylyltransferase